MMRKNQVKEILRGRVNILDSTKVTSMERSLDNYSISISGNTTRLLLRASSSESKDRNQRVWLFDVDTGLE